MAGALVYEKVVEQDLDVGVGEVEITAPAGGKMKARRVNIASFAFITKRQSWTPGTVVGGSFQSVTINLIGVTPGDFILASWTGIPHSQVIFHAVAATDAVICALTNNGPDHNPGTGVLRIAVFKTDI